jgi:hypothetical protein
MDRLRNRPIRNKNCLWWPCLLMDRDKMSNLYREPSIDASYKVSGHLAKRFQRIRFLEVHIVQIHWQTWPPQEILVSDWSISKKSSGQMVSEEKNLKNQPIRNKNRLWWPCLLTDRDGMSNLYRGLVSDWLIFYILLLWNCLAKWTETW